MGVTEKLARDPRIESIELEPDIFITLKSGWQLDGAHSFGEYYITDAIETMKRVVPCNCEACRRG